MLSERRAMIRDYITSHGEATVAELLKLCGDCSSMTLWRDLKSLEDEGSIRRTRGGAISARSILSDTEGLYSKRARERIDEKRRIALAALPYVRAGMSVYLDAGSTLMNLARLLPDLHYTVITSGANVAIELSQRSACNVLLAGGQISGNTLSCSGPQAEAFLDLVNIDTAVMATSGYSKGSGFTSGSFSERELKRKVINKAASVIMLMDTGKLGRALPFTFAGFPDINVLVTNAPLDKETMDDCETNGVEVVVAK